MFPAEVTMAAPTTEPNDEQTSQKSLESRRGTALRMSILASVFAGVLVVGFFLVNVERRHETNELAEVTKAEVSRPPPVDVVSAKSSPLTQRLVLPGETAAWYDSKIYARVNGYVKNWLLDIGDQVSMDETLALIETPEL